MVSTSVGRKRFFLKTSKPKENIALNGNIRDKCLKETKSLMKINEWIKGSDQ